MGPRTWAAIGNVLKISAIFGYVGGGLLGYRAFQLKQLGISNDLVLTTAAVAIVTFVVAILMWNLKGPLVSGNLIVRLFVGVYMLLWVVSTVGLGLIFIGIVYLFTSEPDNSEVFKGGKPAKPRFSPPSNWQPTGRVGPSGAMVYSTANRDASVGILDSWIPIQVTDKRNGYAHVVAATGEGGWIDVRTMTEGV